MLQCEQNIKTKISKYLLLLQYLFYYSILSTSDWFLITLTLEFSLSFTSMEPSCVQKEWTLLILFMPFSCLKRSYLYLVRFSAMNILSLLPFSFILLLKNHVSLPVGRKPHYDGYFTIFCLAYWMRSTYIVDV